MGFIDVFITMTCDLSLTERDIHTRVRKKFPRHEGEDVSYFYAKILAYWYLYQPDLELGVEPLPAGSPAITIVNPEQRLETWVSIGDLPVRPLQRFLHSQPKTPCYHVFYKPSQLEHACNQLRGSTENWVRPVQFLSFDPQLLEEIAELENTSPRWNLIMPDSENLYLTINDHYLHSVVKHIDIWAEFQQTLSRE
jgi:hypothetical protein